jgi:hypothetical protein
LILVDPPVAHASATLARLPRPNTQARWHPSIGILPR